MADKYDKVLEKYFTGGLDLEIKMREQELRNPQQELDENIGGGRAQFKQSNSVENIMMKIESDEYLNELKELRIALKTCVHSFDEEHRKVFYERYRNRMSWELIAQQHHADERTVRRWKDDLKETCRWYGI